jgi:hypothetical protein
MAKTILVVAQVIDESSGDIVDANTTTVTGRSDAEVAAFGAALKQFGEDQTKAAFAAGAKKEHIRQNRHSHGHGHGKP